MKIASNTTTNISPNYYTVPDNYDFQGNSATDETSILSAFHAHYVQAVLDYKNFRTIIGTQSVIRDFNNLTQEEKELVCQNFATSADNRYLLYTTVEQIEHGRVFHYKSIDCREKRFERAAVEAYNRLLPTQTAVIINDIVSANLSYNYIQFGQEGKLSGDSSDGLFDYLSSNNSSGYASTGLLSKGYTPIGMTLSELSARILDILQNGAI